MIFRFEFNKLSSKALKTLVVKILGHWENKILAQIDDLISFIGVWASACWKEKSAHLVEEIINDLYHSNWKSVAKPPAVSVSFVKSTLDELLLIFMGARSQPAESFRGSIWLRKELPYSTGLTENK